MPLMISLSLLFLYCMPTVYFDKKESKSYVLPRHNTRFQPRVLEKSCSLDMTFKKDNSEFFKSLESISLEELQSQKSGSTSNNFELFISTEDLVGNTDSNALCFFIILSVLVMFSFTIIAIIIALTYSK